METEGEERGRKNFISCLSWIKRGVAKSNPDRVQLTTEELRKLIEEEEQNIKRKSSKTDAENKGNDEEDASAINDDDDDGVDVLAKYDLDQYDNEEEDESNPAVNIANLTVFACNQDDPYITLKDTENDPEEEENYQIRPDDNLIAVGKVEGDAVTLEIYVYNEEEESLYVHHDLILPAYPLSIEWLNFDPGDSSPGNFIAIGDMTPVIQVWDIDVVDTLESSYTLGKKIKKKSKAKHRGHRDAVLDLSWNKLIRQALASGSADYKVFVWDLQDGRPVTKFSDHQEKVQSLEWHPCESHLLLSGGCDRMVKIFDCRSTENAPKSWELDGEVEKVMWNHFDPFYFLASTDQGSVHCIDARNEKPVYMIKAHHEPVTGLSLSSQHPGCLVTASTDGLVKIWDIKDKPKFIVEKNFNLGSLYALGFSPDSALVFAVGGDNPSKNFEVCDIGNMHCASRFSTTAETVDTKQETPLPSGSGTNEFMNTEETINSMVDNLKLDFSRTGSKPKFRKFRSKRL